MARYMLTIEDTVNPQTGRPALKMTSGSQQVGTERPDDPPTMALAIGATINRLWESGSLVPMSRCVAPDIVQIVMETSGVAAAPVPEVNPAPQGDNVVDLSERRG